MASGSFQSSTSYSCYAHIAWYSTAGTGGSTVYANLYFNALYRYSFTFRNGYVIGINNNNKSGNGLKVTSAGDWLLLSHSVWVGYTGNCSVGISGYVDCTSVTNSSTGNKLPRYNVGGVATLDKVGEVPSVPNINQTGNSNISEIDKTIVLSWSKSTSYNGKGIYRLDVSINGGAWSYVSGDIDIGTTSWSYPISNHAQGTTFKFRVSCGNDVGWSSHTQSGTFTINKLGIGTMTVDSVFNPYTATQSGSNSVLKVDFSGGSQNISGSLYYKAQLYYNNELVDSTIFTSAKDAKTLNILYPAVTYTNKLGINKYADDFTIKAWLENQNGTKSDVIQATFKVDINTDGGANPTMANPTITGGALNNPSTCFIAHETTINISSGAVTFRRTPSNATVTATYSIKNNNEEVSKSNTASFDCWQTGTFTYSITAVDSRGLSVSIEKQYVVQSYTSPRVLINKSGRKDSPNTTATISYSIYYSPIYQYTSPDTRGKQLNGVSVQQYSKNNGTWTNYSSGADITNLDVNYSYNFEIRVADKFKTTNYVKDNCVIPTMKSTMSMRHYGVGFGCIPQSGNIIEITGHAQFNDNVTIGGVTNVQDIIQLRSGTNAANKRLLDFGWHDGNAQYGAILDKDGGLRFTAYKDGVSQHDTLKLNADGSVSLSEVKGTTNGVINVGLLRCSDTREWVGMYDIDTPSDRYFWFGRNKDTEGIFHFSGESSINKFLFNKPIEAVSYNGYVFDFETQNQTDTWVLVKKDEKIQHLWIGWSNWFSCGTNACGVKLQYRYNEALRLCELNWDGVVNAPIGGNTMGYMWTGFPADKKPKGNMFIPVPNPAADAGLVIRYYPVANDITKGNFTLTSLKNTINNVYICGFYTYSYA